MAMTVDTVITTGVINNDFISQVKNTILSGVNHSGNVPMDGSYEMVPASILGALSSVPNPSVGVKDGAISASQIYNNLVEVTRILTRVGTWTYTRTYNTNGNISVQHSGSGRALFNSNYIKSLPAVANGGVALDGIISIRSINTLFANLLAAWRSANKHNNVKRVDLCHSRCHSNCHSDCHSKSSCYK